MGIEIQKIDCIELKCPHCDHIMDYVVWDEEGQNFLSYSKQIESYGGRIYRRPYDSGHILVCEQCEKPFKIKKEGEILPTYEQLNEQIKCLNIRLAYYAKAKELEGWMEQYFNIENHKRMSRALFDTMQKKVYDRKEISES